jgi:hypothetical protein
VGLQAIADIIETEGVDEVSVEQTDDVTPREEGARLLIGPGGAGQFGHEMVGNEVAELPQHGDTAPSWNARFGVLQGSVAVTEALSRSNFLFSVGCL